MKKSFNKVLAVILSLLIVFSAFPAGFLVFAIDNGEEVSTGVAEVNLSENSITAESSLNLVYGETDSLNALATSGGDITYSSSDSSVATVDSNGTVTAKGVGTATITMTVAADDEYESATATANVKVTPSDNAITCGVSGSANVGYGETIANPFTIASDAYAYGTVKYESNNPSFADVDPDTGVITIGSTADEAIITATFTPYDSATSNYKAVSVEYTVSADYIVTYDYDGKWTNEGTIYITGMSNDDTAYFTIDGGTTNYEITNGEISVSGTAEIGEGTHTVSVYVNDELQETFTVMVDKTGPEFTFSNSNSETEYVNKENYTNITVSGIDDATSGIASIIYTVNGNEYTVSATDNEFTIAANKLSDGKNEIVITVTDNAGNEYTKEITVYMDTTAPVVTLKSGDDDYDGGWFNDADFDLTVDIQGEDEDASGVDTVVYTLEKSDGTSISINEEIKINSDDEYILSVKKLGLEEGEYTLTVTVTDNADNETEVTADLKFDGTLPEVALTYDYDEAWINDAEVEIGVFVAESGSGGARRYYIIDDSSETEFIDDTINIADLGLSDGTHIITVYAEDSAGNTGFDSVTVKLDTTDPEVTWFEFERTGDTAIDDLLRKLTYGGYFNEGVKVTVYLSDNESGLTEDYITLTATSEDGSTTKTYDCSKYNEREGTAVFEIADTDFSAMVDGGTVFQGTVSVTVTDNAGNTASEIKATTLNSNGIDIITWEQNAPEVTLDPVKAADYKENEGTDEEVQWYSEIPEITFSASDTDSGIVKYVVTYTYVNDAGETVEETFTNCEFTAATADELKETVEEITLNLSEPSSNGSYTITAAVYDVAGNCTTKTFTFYVDDTIPYITEILFNGETPVKADPLSSDEPEYKYYFREETEVTITATDNGLDGNVTVSSGLCEIYYKLVSCEVDDVDSIKFESAEVGDDGSITFIAPAGFKGDIIAYATDNVGYEAEQVTPDSIIIETQKAHDEYETHIEMTLAGYSDGCWYNEAVNPVITVTDTYAGIKEITVDVEGDSLNDTYGDTYSKEDDLTGWTTAGDGGLITSAEMPLEFIANNENCSNITITVTMTDNCGNTSEEKYTFNIDSTEPEGAEEYTDAGDDIYTDSEGLIWYNGGRTLTATVTERDIADWTWTIEKKNDDGEFDVIDSDSYGVNGITVTDNGQTVEGDGNGDDSQYEQTVVFAEDGVYKVSYTVTDYAGNTYTSNEETFGIDTTAPTIADVTVNGSDSLSYYNSNGTGLLIFNNAAEVTVTLEDAGCGIGNRVSYYTVSAEGTTSDITHLYVEDDGTVTFSLLSGFNGSIYVTPYDNLGNYNNNPYNLGLLAEEDADTHYNAGTHVSITGVDEGVIYNDEQTVTVTVTDNEVGISSVSWSISGSVDNLGTLNSEDLDNYGWDIKTDEIAFGEGYTNTVVTKATRTFTVTDNYSSITVTVKMTDYAGNTSEDTVTFGIDTTDPTIDVADPEAEETEKYTDDSGLDYYSCDVTFGFAITERDIASFEVTGTLNGEDITSDDYNITNIGVTTEAEDNGDNKVTEKSVTFTKDGTYSVTFTVTDEAGNKAEVTRNFVIDKTVPEITSINFEGGDEDPSAWQDALNLLTFGIFYNDDVKVTVEAEDKEETSASGISEYTLCIGDKEYVSTDGVFTIKYEDYDEQKEITVTATDNVNNTCEPVSPTDVKSNAKNSTIMLESSASAEEITISATGSDMYEDSEGNIWYSDDVEFSITVTDELSGIRNITVTINGDELENNNYNGSETHSEELTVNTSEAVIAEDGSYTINVTYTDNAGNTASATSKVYKDTDAPEITSVIFEGGDDASSSIWNDIWNLLTFGIFYNDKVKVTVEAEDNDPATGVKGYTLYIDDTKYAESTDGVFTIKYEDYTYQKEITVTATDNVNNTCNAVSPTDVDGTNANNNTIMLEKGSSVITIDIPDSTDSAVRYDKDGNAWYSGDIDFTVNASDELSGIRTVTASINDTELYNSDDSESYYSQKDKTTVAKEFTVNTGDADINDNGSYVILVTVTDNAGNETTATKTVYKDTTAPVVTDITFTADGSAWSEALNLLTFGIFYNDDVKVTVEAEDNDPATGIKEYNLYIGGELYKTNTTGEFTIDYDDTYEEQKEITVTVTDNVDNTCAQVTPTSADTTNAQNDTIMLEQGTSSIAITLPEKDKNGIAYHTDNEGNIWYGEDAVISVEVTDEFSGIRSITADVNGLTFYTASFNEESTKTTSDSFTIDTEDANSVIEKDGSYTLTVTVTDNAGNEATAQQTVYTDMTAPEITDITFESGKDEPNSVWDNVLNLLSFGIFYNDDVKVTVSAVDRLDESAKATSDTVKTYTLYIDEEEYDVNEDGVFTIAYEDYTSGKLITAMVTDYAGNNSLVVSPDDVKSNAQNSYIMLESDTEEIALSVTAPSTATSYTDSDSKIWYSEDVDFNIAVTDALSGIRNITVTINGEKLRNIPYYDSETHSEELTVNTSEAVRAEDGSYTIYVEYTDNAGNTESTTSTIYKDIAVPVVTSVIFEGGDGASKSVWEDVLNLLTFGTFYDDDVKVTVTARDDSPATGVKEYTLYIGGELYETNSTGVFTIDYEDYDERQEITVTATDNVNNTCNQITPTAVGTTNASSDMIMLESDTEDITVSVAAPDYTDSKNNYWYSDDVDFNIAVTDDLSGIRNITVSINGTELRNIDYYTSETHSESLTVNTSEAVRAEDGSYTIYVEYTDNAGNTASTTSTVYKDISVPVVTAVTFEGGADEPESVWEKALNLLTFGIFYNDDVKVTVAAEDDYPTSGIKEYTLYIGGEKYAVSTDGVFTIEYEDYTSQKEITVTATDNVNNTCNRVTPTSVDTNASDNTIMLEQGTSAIAITLPGTDKNGIASHTDSSGSVWYAEDAVLSVKVTDELSGIRSIEASVNGLTLYTASFNEESTKTTSDSFTIDTEDANSVMRADGSYTLTVTVTDNAGNEVTAQQTVYTDRTAPEITDITFESGADEPNSVWNDILNLLTFGIFYNDDVKVTVSAVDRLDTDANATAETVETYTLYIDGEEYETNSTGVFVIAYEDYTALKRITAEVTDYAGNNSGKINPADVSSDAHNSNIMLESDTEEITLSVTAPSTATSYTDSDSKIWYSEDVDFNIGVTDELSGIRNITVTINGTELRNIDYYTSETHSADLTVNTSEAVRNDDGSYTIYVEYTDNAGNTASTTSTIYKDIAVPVVTSVMFEGGDDASNSIWSDIWNLITFGIFYNDDVKVTVTARDDSPATGVKEYTLYVGGEEYAVSTDGVFTIAYEDYTSQKEITVTATDNVNNTCDQITPTSVDTNASNDTIMLEQGTSAITIDIPESADSAVRYDKDGNAWYSGDIDFTVNASDELSGIRTVTASINGTELYTKDYYGQDAKTTTADEFTVNTGDAVINDNGSYVILVTVTDNAGNVTTATKTVYKDTAAPIVTDITFTANSSAWSETLNLLTFGIFFNSDVTVTVSAVDNDPTAGIKEYTLYVGDREAQTNTTGVFTISDEDYAAIELISVTVTDNVLNTCSPVNPTSVNTNASNDGIMLENSSANIEITIPSQSDRTDRYTDSSNRIWYSGDIDYTVKVTDEGSGIRNITADINGTELFNENYYEEESATAEKTLTLNTGDAVRNSDGSYVLTVTVTDNADNVSTKSQTVYKDTDVPVITSVEFSAENEESTWSEILNLLTFGIFYNDDVHVSVGARDDSPAAGVKEYTLYVGGTEVETNTEGEFTISYENYTSQQEITVTATDNVGNTCARTTPSQAVDTNAQNDTIMLEATDGAITITIPDSTSEAVRFDRADGTVWYSGDIDFAVNVVDTQSGIRSITADINGTVLVNNSYNLLSEKTTNVSFSINTADAVRNDDGSYEITVVVTDNAGNQFEQSSVVYKDISTPVVTDITFTDEDGNTVDVLAEYGTYDAASGNYIIECQETIYAVITAADSEPSSGISDIGYTLTDAATGNTVNAADTDFTGYDTVSATRRVKINANFKGTLTAYVVDNVSNTSATVNPGSAIIETQATHDSEANHITMSLANYTEGYYYNTTVTPVITVKDTYAGIKDIVVEITANGSAYKTINASSLTSADGKGWTINSTDENLVTSASMSIPVTIESNNIIIKVTLTDNALNTSEQQYMFHIDLTAPVISCSLTSNATPVSGYYSDTVTANITVVEHNFNASAFSITEGSVTGWSNSGDVWTATATFSGEGEHQFTMSCTDLAGNTGTSSGSDGTFYVDLTDPVATVQNMSYGQTNNDDDDITFSIVITDALRLSDSPLSMTFTVWYLTDDGVLASGDFTLDELQDMGFITYTSTSGTTEYTYTISLIKDGIYSFVCTVTDMSGRTSSSILYSDENSSSASVTDFEFSINREGSTYKVLWQDEDVSVENGQIASTGSTEEGIIQVSDIVITEYNPDAIDTEGDGTVISISQGVNMAETVNVDAETDESEKYSVNTYVISREDYFNEDGVYTLQIETTDAAGNVSNGISEDSESGETSKNYRSVSFTVDTTAPEVYADSDFTSYFSIQAEEYSFHIEIDDLTTCYLTVTATEGGSTYPLSVTLDGETVTAENLELSGSAKAVTLTLEEKSYDEIAIDVVDAVGLTYSDVKKSITISTSSLRVLFNRISGFLAENKWVYALIIGVPVLIVVLLILVLRRKKKDDDNPENTKKKEKKSKDKKNKGKTGKK